MRRDLAPDYLVPDYVVEHLATPEGVLVIDATGLLRQGNTSAPLPVPQFHHQRGQRKRHDHQI